MGPHTETKLMLVRGSLKELYQRQNSVGSWLLISKLNVVLFTETMRELDAKRSPFQIKTYPTYNLRGCLVCQLLNVTTYNIKCLETKKPNELYAMYTKRSEC